MVLDEIMGTMQWVQVVLILRVNGFANSSLSSAIILFMKKNVFERASRNL
jgi:hypothetical protein